jgi:hypothetical protein
MKYFLFFLALSVSVFAADKRVKDLGTTATSPATDDYTVIDGATNGTRKILTNNLIGNISGGVATYGNATTAVTIAVNASGRITAITENAITGSNTFGNIIVSGQTTVTSNSTGNLTLVAGDNIVITTDNTTKAVTINATGGGSGSGNVTNNAVLASGNIVIGGGTTVVGTSAMSWNATNATLTIGAAGAGNITANVITGTSLTMTDFTTTNLTVTGNLVSTTVTDGQFFIGNNTGDRLQLGSISGTGITVTNSAGGIALTQKGRIREQFLTIDTVADSMNYGITYVTDAVTVVGIKGVHTGAGLSSPSVVATLKHGTDRTSGTTIEAVTITSSTTGTADDGTLADATVPAGSWIWVETSSKSGTTANLELVIRYTHD